MAGKKVYGLEEEGRESTTSNGPTLVSGEKTMKRKQNQMTLFQCFNKSAACPVSTAASGNTKAGANVNVSERETDKEATSALSDGREEGPADAIAVPDQNTKAPMDKVVKVEPDDHNGHSWQSSQSNPQAAAKVEPDDHNGHRGQSSQSNPQAAARAAEQHTTHTLRWCSSDKKIKKLTCDHPGAIEDVLMRNGKFKQLAEKNKKKELVITKGGQAISSHFPCCLIDDEPLTITYIKAVDKPKQSAPPRIKGQSGKPVLFHLSLRGGKNIVRILRNPALKEDINEMTVYGYKGEKVKHALRRDGRLADVVFKKNCELFQTDTEETIEFSNLVDDLNDKHFKIQLINNASPPHSQPSSLDEGMMPSEGQMSDSERNQDPSQLSPTTESGNNNTPNKKRKMGSMALNITVCTIPESEKIKEQLTREFKSAVKVMKTMKVSEPKSLSQIQNLFRVEYGKKAEACMEVKTMKSLMELSNSVCHVRINSRAAGSGFLLFDRFVLTNCHVINKVLDQSPRWLREKVTVHFSFESLGEEDGKGVDVEEVVGFGYKESGHGYDWALLRLGGEVGLPDCLLTYFGFLPPSGGICIIGHPDGGVKKIDPCFIIPPTNYEQIVVRHREENPQGVLIDPMDYGEPEGPIQLVSHHFFDGVKEDINQKKNNIVAYKTCFYFGSSGSPVFDEHCNVVAIHSGGYYNMNAKGEGQSVIEYGYLLSNVITHIIIKIVEGKRFDVLKKYLSFDFAKKQELMNNVKKLYEIRDLAGFRDALHSPEVTNDESLKRFFESICQRPEPEPMETE